MITNGTAFIIGELISAVTKIVVEAFVSKDVLKLEKVTDILSQNDPLRIEVRKALEEEKTREAFEDQDRRRL